MTEIKIDIVRDSGPQFGSPQQFGVVRVDTLENIGANKVGALFGCAAFRDYVDLYFILREGGLTFPHLLGLAKQKDIGLQEFYLASWIKQQTPKLHTPPTMLKEVDFEEVALPTLTGSPKILATNFANSREFFKLFAKIRANSRQRISSL